VNILHNWASAPPVATIDRFLSNHGRASPARPFPEARNGERGQARPAQLRRLLDQFDAVDVMMVTRLDRQRAAPRHVEHARGDHRQGQPGRKARAAHGTATEIDAGAAGRGPPPPSAGRDARGTRAQLRRGKEHDFAVATLTELRAVCRNTNIRTSSGRKRMALKAMLRTRDTTPAPNGSAMLTKLEVARRQLGTAFDLFIRDRDPVSVQSLACGAGEILDILAEQTGTEPFSTHILAARSDLDIVKLKHIRNQYWNAFKHATTHKGEPRDDAVLLNSFSDEQNDGALFTGWHDYAQVPAAFRYRRRFFRFGSRSGDRRGRGGTRRPLSLPRENFEPVPFVVE